MAAPVQRLQATKLPTLPASTTPEQRYWRSFTSPLLIHEYSSITSIHFSPHAPHDFCITSASLLKILSSKTRTVNKTISRFKDSNVYSGQIRSDGKILGAASASGTIQIFDLASRAVLRSWEPTQASPAQVLRWNPTDLTSLATGSDDRTVKLYNLAANAPTHTFSGHEDYVRALTYLPGSPALVSGSYDTTVKLWDPRTKNAQLTMLHSAPIESLLALPGGTTLLVASANSVRVWDLIAGREQAVLTNHQKTVTSLAHTNGTRVLTGALDGHVKIYDTKDWSVVHGVKYPKPVLAVAVSPDERHLVVGMVDGLLSIRTRSSGAKKDVVKEKERAMDLIARGLDPLAVKKAKTSAKARRLRGLEYKGEGEDVVVAGSQKVKRERAFEKELRKGRYADALDRVLRERENGMVLTVVKELVYRGAVGKALANRDEAGLRPVLEWCVRCVGDPRMVGVVAEVVEKTLDLYSHALGQSVEFDSLVRKLRNRVVGEVNNARAASRAVGMMGLLMSGVEQQHGGEMVKA